MIRDRLYTLGWLAWLQLERLRARLSAKRRPQCGATMPLPVPPPKANCGWVYFLEDGKLSAPYPNHNVPRGEAIVIAI